MARAKMTSAEEVHKLWARFQQDDVQAWSDLLESHYRTLFNYGRRLRADRELIHDCIQGLFLNLWDNRNKLNPAPETVSFYLLQAFRNLLVKELRKQHRLQTEYNVPFETISTVSIEDLLIDQESAQLNQLRIKQLLNELSPREQEVLFLKYYENLTNQQIAHLLNIRKQSVANLLHLGLHHLRHYWTVKFKSSSLLWILFFWKL